MILLSHPTGNQNSRAVLHAFAREQLLFEFHTSFATFEDNVFKKYFIPSLNRRQFDNKLKPYIRTYPYYEFRHRLLNALKLQWLLPRERAQLSMYDTGLYINRRIANRIMRLDKGQIQAVYAYEDMAKQAFLSAKDQELQCFYDLPIGYWRVYWDLLSNEQKLRPEWADTLVGFDSSQKKLDKKDEELSLADHIFVASQFTAKTLTQFPGQLKAQVHIIPYGFPQVEERVHTRSYSYDNGRGPLKMLFVGGLSQRKGLSYLFEAASAFGDHIELTIVGRKVIPDCMALNKALDNCHQWYPSLPHSKVLELMRASDVLIFPSLFEGFGLVITEAMSQGTPVITTERTAGPDLIIDGENGLLARAGDSEDLKSKIDILLSNPKKVARLGEAAHQTAAQRPWTYYGKELTQTIKQILEN